MDERGQFTFYRSFWEAIKGLPKKDRLPILESIISYALDGQENKGLTQSQYAFFLLVKPTLDSSRKKAANGKQGGSKPKANDKQDGSEKEIEKEIEIEIEKEIEIEIDKEIDKQQTASAYHQEAQKPVLAPAKSAGSYFKEFWELYPVGRRGDREEAWTQWKEKAATVQVAEQIIGGLKDWIDSDAWADEGGRYIPGAAKFIREERWKAPPDGIASSSDDCFCDYSETLAYAKKLMQKKEAGEI